MTVTSSPAFFRRCTCQCDKGQPLYHYRGTTERKRASPPGLAGGLRRERIRLQCRRPEFYPLVGKIPWRRKWQATPVFLPGESHGQRKPQLLRPWGLKESDMSEPPYPDTQSYLLVSAYCGLPVVPCSPHSNVERLLPSFCKVRKLRFREIHTKFTFKKIN